MNIDNLNLISTKKYIRYRFNDEKFSLFPKIDMETLDKIIEELEKKEDDPTAWIPFEEAMDEIRNDILN